MEALAASAPPSSALTVGATAYGTQAWRRFVWLSAMFLVAFLLEATGNGGGVLWWALAALFTIGPLAAAVYLRAHPPHPKLR